MFTYTTENALSKANLNLTKIILVSFCFVPDVETQIQKKLLVEGHTAIKVHICY